MVENTNAGSEMNITEEDRVLLHRLFKECGPLFIALGDEIRQKLLLDIIDAGSEGINVNSIAAGSKLSRPAISHHLKIMKDCGVLEADKQGTQIFYKVAVHKRFAEVESLIKSTVELIDKVNKREGLSRN